MVLGWVLKCIFTRIIDIHVDIDTQIYLTGTLKNLSVDNEYKCQLFSLIYMHLITVLHWHNTTEFALKLSTSISSSVGRALV